MKKPCKLRKTLIYKVFAMVDFAKGTSDMLQTYHVIEKTKWS